MNFSSKLLENAVNEFARFPGIGHKTALRLVLSLLNQPSESIDKFTGAITQLKQQVCYCKVCRNISDQVICELCSNVKRDQSLICVVEDIRDVMAIENTNQFNGVYHVLGGLISPMNGIGPADLSIEKLIERIKPEETREIILALSATMEGDTTIFYLYKKLKDFAVPISTIARGIAVGGGLEYVDEVTLGRSIITRIPYENSLVK
ncbi:MAG: recombination mediator RecR [Sphingobacteriaceae bacterium]|jgi:recombination protein RecR|nr:MAG: recombination protein RecR [Pedobacter sp.]